MKNTLIFALVCSLLCLTSDPSYARGKRGRAVSGKKASESNSGSGGGDALLRILAIENRRAIGDRYLLNALKNPSRRVVEAAITAVGRVGDSEALEELSRLMNQRDLKLKMLATVAMGLMPDETAATMLVQHLAMQREPEVLSLIYQAVGFAGREKTLPALTQGLLAPSTTEAVRGNCLGLGMFWSGGAEKSSSSDGVLSALTKLATQPEPVGSACAFTLSRYRGDAGLLPTNELLEAVAVTKVPAVRALLLRAVARLRAPQAAVLLAQQAQGGETTAVRLEAIKGLALQPFNEASQFALQKCLADKDPWIVFQALDSLFYQGGVAAALAPSVEPLITTSKSNWIRGTALKTLASIEPAKGRVRTLEALSTPGQPLYGAAMFSLALNPTEEDLTRFVIQLGNSGARIVEETVEALTLLPEERFTPALKAGMKKVLERADVAVTAVIAQLTERYRWRDFAPSLSAVYPLLTQSEQLEAKVSILNALAAVGDATHVPLLETAVKDPDRSVAFAAAQALKALTGRDETGKIPPHSLLGKVDFSLGELEAAGRAKVFLNTKKGLVVMKMNPETPFTALNFVRLVKKRFYHGKTFHRVVPGFVVQGGDPRADGYGGPGYFIHDEPNLDFHARGTVGLATSGRDTGGSQFFINLAPNYHLDGRFTLFAEVIQGMDTVEKLEVGDTILDAQVSP